MNTLPAMEGWNANEKIVNERKQKQREPFNRKKNDEKGKSFLKVPK